MALTVDSFLLERKPLKVTILRVVIKTILHHQSDATYFRINAMSKGDDHDDYRRELDRLAYSISHRFRRPISTMQGLVELIRLGLINEQECEHIILCFKTSLDELDLFSKELNSLVHRELERLEKMKQL